MAMEQYMPARSPSPIAAVSGVEGPADVDETLTPVLGLVTCQGDRSLFEEFIHARLHCRGALVALSHRLMIVNATAGELLQPSDRPRLWALAQDAVKDGNCRIGEVSLGNGTTVLARYRPVLEAGALAGVLVQFVIRHGGRTGAPSGTGPRRDALSGWWELTNAERAIAEVVASGLTNREAGRRVVPLPAYR